MKLINMQYNDIVTCNTNFGTIIAKFMLFRPDKNLVIVDHNKRLHQLHFDKIRLTTCQDIINMYKPKINKCNKEIHENTKPILNIKKRIIDGDNQIIPLLNNKNELTEKFDSLKVMRKLITVQGDSDISNIQNEMNFIEVKLKEIYLTLKELQEQKNNANSLLRWGYSNIEIAKSEKNEYINKINNLMGDLYENTKRTKAISEKSI
jgi:chromosome segregation ATPase